MKKLLFLFLCLSHCLVGMDLDPDLQDQLSDSDTAIFISKEQIRKDEKKPLLTNKKQKSKKVVVSLRNASQSKLTEKQLKKEWCKLKSAEQLRKEAEKDVVPPLILQKAIAAQIVEPVVQHIKNQTQMPNTLIYSGYGRMKVILNHDNTKMIFLEERGYKGTVYDITRWKKLFKLKLPYCGAKASAVFSPDGKTFAVVKSAYGTVWIYDLQNHTLLHTLKGFKHKVLSTDKITYSSDGKLIATKSACDAISIWGVMSGKLLHNLKGITKKEKRKLKNNEYFFVDKPVFSQDGKLVSTVLHKTKISKRVKGPFEHSILYNHVLLWNIETGKLVRRFNGCAVAFELDGKSLLIGDSYGKLFIYDYINNRIIHQFQLEHAIEKIVLSRNFLVVGFNGKGRIFNRVKKRNVDFKLSNYINIVIDPYEEYILFDTFNHQIYKYSTNDETWCSIKEKFSYISNRSGIISLKSDALVIRDVGDRNYQSVSIHWIPQKEKEALQWLTHTLPNQKNLPKQERWLLPDQAEIIRKMYEAHEKGKRLEVSMNDAVRFSKMPDYVKKLLFVYFGRLKQEKVNTKADNTSCIIS